MKLYNAMEESYLKENLIHKWVTNIVRQNDGYEFLLDDEVYLPVYKYALKITKRKTVKLNLVEEKVLQIVSIGVHQALEVYAALDAAACGEFVVFVDFERHGFREACREIDALLFGPARRTAVAADRMVVLLFDEGLRRAVVAVGVEEIYHHLFLPLAGEGVAVQSHALGGGQFDVDAVIVQMQPVVGRG